MRRAIAVALVLALAGCGASDDAGQTDLITVDGKVECAVVRNRANRIEYMDCDWGNR